MALVPPRAATAQHCRATGSGDVGGRAVGQEVRGKLLKPLCRLAIPLGAIHKWCQKRERMEISQCARPRGRNTRGAAAASAGRAPRSTGSRVRAHASEGHARRNRSGWFNRILPWGNPVEVWALRIYFKEKLCWTTLHLNSSIYYPSYLLCLFAKWNITVVFNNACASYSAILGVC